MFKPAWFLHILPYLTTSNRFQSHFSGILQAISSFSETSSIFKNTCHVGLRSGNFEKHVWTWPFNAIYIDYEHYLPIKNMVILCDLSHTRR
jgi:hypothetical protein